MTLNSAGTRKCPMGTAADLLHPSALKSAVVPEAIRLGDGQFDTAKLCRSERALGEAIAVAPDLGLVSSGDELSSFRSCGVLMLTAISLSLLYKRLV